MSNNARVVDGGEIGVAQYLQAIAAGAQPDVRMNPVLVKPEGDTSGQVIVDGIPAPDIAALPWRDRAPHLWPTVSSSLASLMDEYDLVVMEGAGSPAEINLHDCDLSNARAARQAEAAVLLVCDIDRGGAFAHLYGTWALLADADRPSIEGFVLNKFRGDPALLAPAPQRLSELTGVPVLGLIPWVDHRLPDEDGAAEPSSNGDLDTPLVAVVRYPTASNLDEFKPVEQVARLRWARQARDLDDVELLILPGSKNVTADLAWLHSTGLAAAVLSHAAADRPVIGICGGLQMLGTTLDGGANGDIAGLELLPIHTAFDADKITRRIVTRFREPLNERWSAIAGHELRGYEIRHGHSAPTGSAIEALLNGRGWIRDGVLGLTVHGIFENPRLAAALLGSAPTQSLDRDVDELTDLVMPRLDDQHIAGLTRTR